MKFGDYIRQKREKAGLTQPEAAARAKIEQSYLSKLETGKSYPSEEVFDRLVAAYDIDVKDMGHAVQSDELEKLTDISKMRAYVLKERKSRRMMARAWLVAALILMMFGGGLTFYEASIKDIIIEEFIYRSDGLLKEGEDANLFVIAGHEGQPELTTDLADRMIPKTKRLKEEDGQRLVEREGQYIRIYTLDNVISYGEPQRDRALLAVGIALLIGSFGCFIIGFRWE